MDEALPGGSLNPLGSMVKLSGCWVVVISPSTLVPLNSLKSRTDLSRIATEPLVTWGWLTSALLLRQRLCKRRVRKRRPLSVWDLQGQSGHASMPRGDIIPWLHAALSAPWLECPRSPWSDCTLHPQLPSSAPRCSLPSWVWPCSAVYGAHGGGTSRRAPLIHPATGLLTASFSSRVTDGNRLSGLMEGGYISLNHPSFSHCQKAPRLQLHF